MLLAFNLTLAVLCVISGLFLTFVDAAWKEQQYKMVVPALLLVCGAIHLVCVGFHKFYLELIATYRPVFMIFLILPDAMLAIVALSYNHRIVSPIGVLLCILAFVVAFLGATSLMYIPYASLIVKEINSNDVVMIHIPGNVVSMTDEGSASAVIDASPY
jgi:hypothetical protein